MTQRPFSDAESLACDRCRITAVRARGYSPAAVRTLAHVRNIRHIADGITEYRGWNNNSIRDVLQQNAPLPCASDNA